MVIVMMIAMFVCIPGYLSLPCFRGINHSSHIWKEQSCSTYIILSTIFAGACHLSMIKCHGRFRLRKYSKSPKQDFGHMSVYITNALSSTFIKVGKLWQFFPYLPWRNLSQICLSVDRVAVDSMNSANFTYTEIFCVPRNFTEPKKNFKRVPFVTNHLGHLPCVI